MSKQYEKDELGRRMKVYESVPKNFLTLGIPHVIRLDMRAGHTFCRNFKKPFDNIFNKCMTITTVELCKHIPGVKFGYTQSDEISLALNDDFGNSEYSCFFSGNVEKIVSISASIATLEFNKAYYNTISKLELSDDDLKIYTDKLFKAQFDSRVFSLPNETELHNYMLWRQQDATKNSILSLGYAHFSTKELENKNCENIQDMLHEININWNDFPVEYKRGRIITRYEYNKDATWTDKNGKMHTSTAVRHDWGNVQDIPILTQSPNFISDLYNCKF